MNIERMKQLLEHLKQLPEERFDYSFWGHFPDNPNSRITGDQLANHCGTCGCVAGWTCALFSPEIRLVDFDTADEARVLLGLNSDEARFLFYRLKTFGFRSDTFDKYSSSGRGLLGTGLQIAIRKIEFLIERAENEQIDGKTDRSESRN